MEEFPRLRLLVSGRTQVYNGEIDALVDKVLEIQDFSDQQIRRFLRSWAPDMLMRTGGAPGTRGAFVHKHASGREDHGIALHHDSRRSATAVPVRRIGGVGLRSLAEAGYASAVDDLLTIWTPGAAEALVPLLWHNSPEIASRAAFAIAALFQSPEAFAALEEMKIGQPQEAEWVWQPFETHEQTAIPVIAGRVASLTAHELADLPDAKLDPRLALPMCAEIGSELTLVASPENARELAIAELRQRLTSPRTATKRRPKPQAG